MAHTAHQLTRAGARRWLAQRDGYTLDTVQTRPNGMVWRAGPRTLNVTGTVARLDGSRVEVNGNREILDMSDTVLVVEWQDDDGVQISVTRYTVIDAGE